MSETKTQSQPPSSLPQRVWNSIFRAPLAPQSDRERKLMVLDSLILHLHPAPSRRRLSASA
jgi:hypothetical protein